MDPSGQMLLNTPLFTVPLIPQGRIIAAELDRRPDQNRLARAEVQQHTFHYIRLLINILLAAATHVLISIHTPDDSEPYHTSTLTGQEWVIKLIVGHPERICCGLGVHVHVFEGLVNELCALGHTDSCHVSLEEQVAIFLYSCVTGLTINRDMHVFWKPTWVAGVGTPRVWVGVWS
jgi:hypothetical protein